MSVAAFDPHDHNACIAATVDAVERACEEKGLQLTPIRKHVLTYLLERHQAMGAYDILDRLREDGFGSQPPVAYRALDFLVKNGFAHRIEQLNAFVACSQPEHSHAPVFLICNGCETVAEAKPESMPSGLASISDVSGFKVDQVLVEARGLCPKCIEGGATCA